jgi:hypothetical protein
MSTIRGDTPPVTLSGDCDCGRTVEITVRGDRVGQAQSLRVRPACCPDATVYLTTGHRTPADPAWVRRVEVPGDV